ncbi:DUF3500 domain-containing protein [Haloactinomyces albus]|uniref:DUF3500 domain-containing protein n=1 Tax=Haloactinomyces albus TaxID=1352928 RepID=A0AAE4CMT0_9ACTN|nr:DUF3500 domain-containing protein [Haloactinomyces albus]MDR7303730.1 hypothetical protein [Haloactinomyces albus]
MTAEQCTPRDVATAMAEAAAEWIATLDDTQRSDGVWHWPGSPAADHERVRWYYTPTDHGGLTLHRMAPHQQRAAMRLLAAGLSDAGYATATTIMGLENVLDRTENFTAGFARDRGRDPGMYYLRVFGDPQSGRPWAWRYGGHHVSVNHLVVDGEVVAGTPCFLGADPAVSPLLGGRELRPLGGVEDIARELLHSLDSQERDRATLSTTAPVDIISGNRVRLSDGDRPIPLPDLWRGHFDDQPLEDRLWSMHNNLEAHLGVTESDHRAVELTKAPKGIAARDLPPERREHLRELLEVYIGRMPSGLVERERARFDGDLLDEVHFAWAGGAERGEPHYYRVQGPHLLAEWDHTQRGVNHAHSVWRDPTHDFGLDVLAQHRAAHHTSGTSRRKNE